MDIEFKLISKPLSQNDGHFVWLSSDFRVTISDWGGPHPCKTDDGPLYIDKSRDTKEGSRRWGDGISVPVLNENGAEVWFFANPDTIRRINSALEFINEEPLKVTEIN